MANNNNIETKPKKNSPAIDFALSDVLDYASSALFWMVQVFMHRFLVLLKSDREMTRYT